MEPLTHNSIRVIQNIITVAAAVKVNKVFLLFI